MVDIPQAKDSDAEDVAWGLQTAEALWRRGERQDAIVWLRRAAKAAMDASDDDRAVELARCAADLSEPFEVSAASQASPLPSAHVPEALTRTRTDEGVATPLVPPPSGHAGPRFNSGATRSPFGSVPSAEYVHAGMFNPWEEGTVQRTFTPPDDVGDDDDDERVHQPREPQGRDSQEEVVTSLRPPPLPGPSSTAKPAGPPPLPLLARKPLVAPPIALEAIEAFSDLPDETRQTLAAAANVALLGEGEEVSRFALALVLSGSFDVAATMIDAPAARLEVGAVLRARGSIDASVPIRLMGVQEGFVATWTDAAVEEAVRGCPWVEEDLRAASDRIQTLVGVTIGPLGERLDASIREQIVTRLTMRTLLPGQIFVTAGQAVPGLFLVGVGEVELVTGTAVQGVVGSGEFLFPGEILGAGAAPYSARAGAAGATVLFGNRMVAQELLVTCPPLLEVFAGM